MNNHKLRWFKNWTCHTILTQELLRLLFQFYGMVWQVQFLNYLEVLDKVIPYLLIFSFSALIVSLYL